MTIRPPVRGLLAFVLVFVAVILIGLVFQTVVCVRRGGTLVSAAGSAPLRCEVP